MSWTAFKKRLRPGARVTLVNMRQPWRSRPVEVVTRSKRSIVVKDPAGDLASIKLPAAAFTRNVDEDTFELLAEEDGPRFHAETRKRLQQPLFAGTPYLTMSVIEEAPET